MGNQREIHLDVEKMRQFDFIEKISEKKRGKTDGFKGRKKLIEAHFIS